MGALPDDGDGDDESKVFDFATILWAVDLAELPEMNFPRQFSNSFFLLNSHFSWKQNLIHFVAFGNSIDQIYF